MLAIGFFNVLNLLFQYVPNYKCQTIIDKKNSSFTWVMWDIASCHFAYMNGNQLWKSEGEIKFLCLRWWGVKNWALWSVWNELESRFLKCCDWRWIGILKQWEIYLSKITWNNLIFFLKWALQIFYEVAKKNSQWHFESNCCDSSNKRKKGGK